MGFIEHPLDDALIRFDRDTATNVLLRGPSTRGRRRVAPRTLQIGLLTPCNLRCSFCYRDKDAKSLLDAPFLLDLLRQAARWGVLEVAFGGGEPLLFREFVPMLKELHQTTTLGLGFTTNGMLLTDEIVSALRDVVAEIRISAYPDNHYRNTLRRVREIRTAVNWLVTPENIGLVEPMVHDALSAGASNVLLLGYKGATPELHLQAPHFAQLSRTLQRLSGLPLRIDVCWRPHLRGVDALFERNDCGAGDEFLVITPDRAVQACSFADRRIPFHTFADLQRIYGELRANKPHANVIGCTRDLFQAQAKAQAISAPPPVQESAWTWHASASNNSGDYTIMARFCDEETAQKAAVEIAALGRAHEAFLASEAGQQWIKDKHFDLLCATPPLEEFGERHGFEWDGNGRREGLSWETAGDGGPVLTSGAIGNAVVVYHPYCMGLPDEPFELYFQKLGATAILAGDEAVKHVLVSARGRNDVEMAKLAAHLEELRLEKYSSDMKTQAPWGKECQDPRLLNDEDRDARLRGYGSDQQVQTTPEGVKLKLRFENSFAGPLALHGWLKQSGYHDIEIAIEPFQSR